MIFQNHVPLGFWAFKHLSSFVAVDYKLIKLSNFIVKLCGNVLINNIMNCLSFISRNSKSSYFDVVPNSLCEKIRHQKLSNFTVVYQSISKPRSRAQQKFMIKRHS